MADLFWSFGSIFFQNHSRTSFSLVTTSLLQQVPADLPGHLSPSLCSPSLVAIYITDMDLDTATCCACKQEGQPFSKRQLKLAAERKPARCKQCIENDDQAESKPASTADTVLQTAIEKEDRVESKASPTDNASSPQNALETNETNNSSPKQEEQTESDGDEDKENDSTASDNNQLVYFSDGEAADKGNDSEASDSNQQVYFSDGAAASASEEEEEAETSLDAIKKQVLGRLVRTSSAAAAHDREEAMLSEAESINLRKELSCAICHDLLYQPVSLHCGHSFCQECFSWWMKHSSSSSSIQEEASCPTCRSTFSCKDNTKLQVNTALRACILALFSSELQSRIEQEQDRISKATRGENGGAHTQGYAEVCRESKQVKTHESGLVDMTRSVVLDAEDQRMQLALSMRDGVSRLKLSSDNQLSVDLCLLTMEEDEVADADGFPWKLLDDGDDDENEALVARQVHSFVEAKARVQQSVYVPIARHGIRDGEVSFLIDVESSLIGADALLFRDEETGAELEFKIPARWLEGGGGPADSLPTRDYGGMNNHTIDKSHDDSEAEGEDEFEEDGFVVMDGDDDEEEEDDEDPCSICGKGGELMVCDGGLNDIEGCGKSFHIECVGLDEVPPGDWVCEACAIEHGMDVGMEGHEFPPSQEEEQDDDDDDGPASRKQPRKRVLEDSDDEEELHEDGSNAKAGNDGTQEEESDGDDNGSGSGPTNPRKRVLEDSGDEQDSYEDASKVKAGNDGTKKRKVILDSDSDDD